MFDIDRRAFLGLTAATLVAGPIAGRRLLAQTPKPLFCSIGVCTGFGKAATVALAGGQHIEDSVGRLLNPKKSDEDFAQTIKQVKAAPIPVVGCNGFIPGNLRSTGPDADHEGVLQWSGKAFERAARLGIRFIVFGSSGSRRIKGDFPKDKALAQFTELLKKMGPQAAKHHVTIAIEPLNRREDNLVNTLAEGAAIAETVDHPNVKIVADIYHMLCNDETPDDIRKVGKWITHCHIAEEKGRSAPGVNNFDFTPWFKALADIGYNRTISIEGRWKDEQLEKAFGAIRETAAKVTRRA